MFTPLITHDSDGTALAAPVDAARRNGATYKTRTIDDLRIKDDRLRAAIEGTGHLLFDGGTLTLHTKFPARWLPAKARYWWWTPRREWKPRLWQMSI